MDTGVRIIKRGRASGLQSLPVSRGEKTVPQCEREIAGTVESWIAESAQRRRAEKQCAFVLLKQCHCDHK
jgi:hypothetical protein